MPMIEIYSIGGRMKDGMKFARLCKAAKNRGLKLKLSTAHNWVDGAINRMVLTRNETLPLHIVERCSSLNYMEERINAFQIVK